MKQLKKMVFFMICIFFVGTFFASITTGEVVQRQRTTVPVQKRTSPPAASASVVQKPSPLTSTMKYWKDIHGFVDAASLYCGKGTSPAYGAVAGAAAQEAFLMGCASKVGAVLSYGSVVFKITNAFVCATGEQLPQDACPNGSYPEITKEGSVYSNPKYPNMFMGPVQSYRCVKEGEPFESKDEIKCGDGFGFPPGPGVTEAVVESAISEVPMGCKMDENGECVTAQWYFNCAFAAKYASYKYCVEPSKEKGSEIFADSLPASGAVGSAGCCTLLEEVQE